MSNHKKSTPKIDSYVIVRKRQILQLLLEVLLKLYVDMINVHSHIPHST
jgi:hypothetical protein